HGQSNFASRCAMLRMEKSKMTRATDPVGTRFSSQAKKSLPAGLLAGPWPPGRLIATHANSKIHATRSKRKHRTISNRNTILGVQYLQAGAGRASCRGRQTAARIHGRAVLTRSRRLVEQTLEAKLRSKRPATMRSRRSSERHSVSAQEDHHAHRPANRSLRLISVSNRRGSVPLADRSFSLPRGGATFELAGANNLQCEICCGPAEAPARS